MDAGAGKAFSQPYLETPMQTGGDEAFGYVRGIKCIFEREIVCPSLSSGIYIHSCIHIPNPNCIALTATLIK